MSATARASPSPGDSLGFKAVLRRVRIRRRGPGRPRIRPGRVLADKGYSGKAYSGKANRAYLRGRGIRGVIPNAPTRSATAPDAPPPVAVLRRSTRASTPDRNVVERAINKLEQSRAVATRYDKSDYVWRGTVDVAAIRIWLRDPLQ